MAGKTRLAGIVHSVVLRVLLHGFGNGLSGGILLANSCYQRTQTTRQQGSRTLAVVAMEVNKLADNVSRAADNNPSPFGSLGRDHRHADSASGCLERPNISNSMA